MIRRIPSGDIFRVIQDAGRVRARQRGIHQDIIDPLDGITIPDRAGGAGKRVTSNLIGRPRGWRIEERIAKPRPETPICAGIGRRIQVTHEDGGESRGLARDAIEDEAGAEVPEPFFLVVEV